MNKNELIRIVFIILFGSMRATNAMANEWDACFDQAGQYYSVSPLLLKAIAQQESAMKPTALHKNKGMTIDVGLMQINSAHHTMLEERFFLTLEKIQQPCQNIILGAWVLADCINVFGNNWEAVGCYNAGTAKTDTQRIKRLRYASQVLDIYHSLTVASSRMQSSSGKVR